MDTDIIVIEIKKISDSGECATLGIMNDIYIMAKYNGLMTESDARMALQNSYNDMVNSLQVIAIDNYKKIGQ